jgi:dsDNA-specific endonuclease/ATPase MutS2
MAVIRFLFALLLGFLVGAGTTIWLVQSGAGDFMIKRTEVVQDLERKVRDLEQQRDSLTRTLEDVTVRTGRMENMFNELERRFKSLSAEQEQGGRPAQRGDGGSREGAEP